MELINIFIYFGTMAGLYAILALTLNFHYGLSGLVNFGHVGFFAVGAYAAAILSTAGMPAWLGFIIAILAAGATGYLVSLPTRKLSVHYWAIMTIAISEVIRLIALNEEWLTRGSFGIDSIPQPMAAVLPTQSYPAFYLIFVWCFVALTFYLLDLLASSPFGRVLKAIREEDDLALALGKPVFRFKVKAMTIGAALAGLAGALYAHYVTYISPIDFMPLITFLIWVMVILGGKGNLWGSVLGGAIIVVFFNSTRYVKDFLPFEAQTVSSLRMVIIGLLIMLVVLYRPQGLLPEKKKEFDR